MTQDESQKDVLQKQPQSAETQNANPDAKSDAKPAQDVSTAPSKGGRDFKKRGARPGGNRPGGRGRGGKRPHKPDVPVESDYEEKNIEVSRVTRVTKGGKRMRFRVLAVIGNHKGRVGFGVAKGLDVAAAMSKATTKARKSLITVPIVHETIPHPVWIKHGAAQLVMKPAPKGTGVKAGGPVRTTLELAGVPNVTAKILGTTNKISNVKAVFEALAMLSAPDAPVNQDQEQADGKPKEDVQKNNKA